MDKVKEICRQIVERIHTAQLSDFQIPGEKLLLSSDFAYGVWLELVNDAVLYAMVDPSKLPLAENAVNVFLRNQKPDGQIPCYIWDPVKMGPTFPQDQLIGDGQIQECYSFASLAWQVYQMNGDRDFLARAYAGCSRWENWLRNHRMTRGLGLIEMFCGYDTGHDHSGRLEGMSCPGNQAISDEVVINAAVLPPEDGVTPIIAVDMSCNFYGTLRALAKMAEELGRPAEEARQWLEKAADVKRRLFDVCFDPEDCFFYDVDKQGRKRKYLSSTILHLFLEGVLDPEEDRALIDELYRRYIGHPDHFATPYPYPSMSVSDPSSKEHDAINCWGYYVQGCLVIRCPFWMDRYGYSEELDRLCRQWVSAWTECFDTFKLGQEIDPITGVHNGCCQWFAASMVMYLYAAKRLGYWNV